MIKLALYMLKISKLELKSIIVNTALLLIFLITNLMIVVTLSLISENILVEIFKWLQFMSLLSILFFLFKKINFVFSFLIVGILYFLYIIIFFFFIFTQIKLDFYFLFTNINGITIFLPKFFIALFIVFLVALINSGFVCKNIKLFRKNALFYIVALILIFFPTAFHIKDMDNEVIVFAKSIYNGDQIINYYQQYQQNLVGESIKNKNNISSLIEKNNDLPNYLDNIIIIHLESLNSFLVNQEITPNFLEIAKEGILFKNFYSNSVETHSSQENMLCSLPTSFYLNLVQGSQDNKVLCLPEIFKTLGYKNFFLKSYDLNFTKTGEFMKNIGFDEVHADDIMDISDPQYIWGYREDIFYERAFDFFEKNIGEKNFLYLQSGPTSHWPFFTPRGFENVVPYKNPINHQERLTNTTFLQDQYLKIAWQELNKIFPEKNYTLIISGDHSWPIEVHQNNVFNQKLSFEENFLSSMLIILGGDEKYKNMEIDTKYSQMDIMPSLLGLFDINIFQSDYQTSFIDELGGNKPINKKILFVQPYDKKYINIIVDEYKYQYNSNDETFLLFNLSKDPHELREKIIGKSQKENLNIIKKLLPQKNVY